MLSKKLNTLFLMLGFHLGATALLVSEDSSMKVEEIYSFFSKDNSNILERVSFEKAVLDTLEKDQAKFDNISDKVIKSFIESNLSKENLWPIKWTAFCILVSKSLDHMNELQLTEILSQPLLKDNPLNPLKEAIEQRSLESNSGVIEFAKRKIVDLNIRSNMINHYKKTIDNIRILFEPNAAKITLNPESLYSFFNKRNWLPDEKIAFEKGVLDTLESNPEAFKNIEDELLKSFIEVNIQDLGPIQWIAFCLLVDRAMDFMTDLQIRKIFKQNLVKGSVIIPLRDAIDIRVLESNPTETLCRFIKLKIHGLNTKNKLIDVYREEIKKVSELF